MCLGTSGNEPTVVRRRIGGSTVQDTTKLSHKTHFLSAVPMLLAFTLASMAISLPAAAHPHVWVSVKTTVVYAEEGIAGFRYSWTFDEMYTAMAIQGLDTNNDGKYDRKELAELAQVNIDALKEFKYFTHAKLNNQPVPTAAPKDYWLEYDDKGILTLHFTLPLQQTLKPRTEGFSFAVYDDSFYIAFDLAKNDPIRLGQGAPRGCAVSVAVPDEEAAEAKLLTESFSEEFDSYAGIASSLAQTATVSCSQS